MAAGGKNEKGERITEENYIKNGGKGLKNVSFWVINSKIKLFQENGITEKKP